MDFVHLSDGIRDGLDRMMYATIGHNEYVQSFVDVEVALLISALAKRAEDRPEWFPRGKWATIQSIEAAIEREITRCIDAHEKDSHK